MFKREYLLLMSLESNENQFVRDRSKNIKYRAGHGAVGQGLFFDVSMIGQGLFFRPLAHRANTFFREINYRADTFFKEHMIDRAKTFLKKVFKDGHI